MSSGQHQRVERRLAAILAADVAGYSRLIEADEEGTLRRFKALRAEIIDPKIAGHRGCIVNQGSQNGGPRHETSLERRRYRCGARDSDTSFSTAHGPGPFRGNRYRPGRRSPRGSGPLLSAPQSAGWVSRSIHRGAVGRRAAVLHPASALLSPAGGVLPAVRLLCPARPRLLRAAARLLLWAAGTVKIGAGERTERPRNRLPSRAFPPLGPGHQHVDVGGCRTWSRWPPQRARPTLKELLLAPEPRFEMEIFDRDGRWRSPPKMK
jgi:class 3 adenylate cyclase